MADDERQVQGAIVRIFDEEYRIGGDAAQVQQVADYVDRKMREIAEGHGSRLPKGKVAILAAMEITAELFKAMQERQMFTSKAHESIGRLTKLVEDRARLSAEGEEGTQTLLQSGLQHGFLRFGELNAEVRLNKRAELDKLGARQRRAAHNAHPPILIQTSQLGKNDAIRYIVREP